MRYADDTIVGFEHETDAWRFMNAMRERLWKFALSLHPDKTRLIEFGRQAANRRAQRGLGKPETFKFLGFTFICNKSVGATFCSNGRPGAIAYGRSCEPSSRTYGGACTSQSRYKGNGWGRSFKATSTTLPYRPTVVRSVRSASSSSTSGGDRCGGEARKMQ